MTYKMRPNRISSKSGLPNEISMSPETTGLLVTFRLLLLVTRISMTTATGNPAVNTEMCGIPAKWSRVGLPITAAIGPGSIRGATPGLMMRPGDLRRSIMDAGPTLAIVGVGVPGPLPEDTVDRATEGG